MKILAIIPARGGSKRIPRKNVLPFKDKPLVAWPIDLAKSVPRINRVIVSTDNDEITEIAKKYGAEVPFRRPPELARDETPTLPVLQHCVRYLEEKENYKADIIALLYPTSPLLKKERLEEALDLFEKTGCNSVVSVVKDWGRFWKLEEKENKYKILHPLDRVNMQYYKPLHRENGAIYFMRYNVLIKMNKMIDEQSTEFIVMDENENVDIDNLSDFAKAQNKEVVLKLRTIKEKDIKRIWEIRNDPLVRANSNNPEEIPLDKHIEWMKNKYFVSADNFCFVLDRNDNVIGYCRFDLRDGKYTASVAIDQRFQGKGLGCKFLKAAIEKIGAGKEILAEIQFNNLASFKIFQKNNFKIYSQDNKNYYLSLIT